VVEEGEVHEAFPDFQLSWVVAEDKLISRRSGNKEIIHLLGFLYLLLLLKQLSTLYGMVLAQ